MLHLFSLTLGYEAQIAQAIYNAGQAIASFIADTASAIHNAPCPADWLC